MMNSDSYYIRKFGYTCPFCHKVNALYLDDLDINFNGNQNEYLACTSCDFYIWVKVRFNKIVKIDCQLGD